MNFEEFNPISLGILAADLHTHEIPAERESLGHGNVETEASDALMRLLYGDGGKMLDEVIAEIGSDFENEDILKYIDPAFMSPLDEGMTNVLNTIDSGNERLRSNLNTSATATRSGYIVPQMRIENNVGDMLSGPLQPLKTSELQPEIVKRVQKTSSQLQEELNNLRQAYLKLQEEVSCLKASQQSPKILQKVDIRKQSQVEPVSTVETQKLEKDVPLNYSGHTRTRRIRKPRTFFYESMQQNADLNNEKNIVSQSETIGMIVPATEEQNQVEAPVNKRPATRNLRSIAKKSRRNSQVSVHQKNINNGIKDYYHDEEDESVDRDEDDTNNINLNHKSKKKRCNTNGNEISKKDDMQEYTRVKNGNRYVCDVKNCNSIFKTRQGLKFHKVVHAGVKPYSCDECKRSFWQKVVLSRHMLIHTGEKPYLCKFCDTSFRHSNTLYNHLKRHTGEKPYLCDVCNSSFRRKWSLKTHMMIHAGEKPFFCKLCYKSFRHRSTLSTHSKTCKNR